MKKTLVIALCIAFAGLGTTCARAGEREWATAGKILTGVVGASILADALDGGGGGYYTRPSAHHGYRYAAPVGEPYYETARPVYYNSRTLAPYPSSRYDSRPQYGSTTVYYEDEYAEPVTYRRRTVTRTY